MTPPPQISVVVCTHNRARYLARALASVLEQDTPPESYELLVIDNRSTDDTAAIAAEVARDRPNVRVIPEPNLGLCHARNRGWREARGQYVAYLDDDAVAEPGWLAAIGEAFEQFPRAGVVGGRVEPIWEAARPAWLSAEIALSLTIVDWSPEPRLISDLGREWLVGANLALPRRVLDEVGGFHPELDRVGRSMLSSGDVFLERLVVDRGHDAVYYPAMAVKHLVPASRLRQAWFRNRYYWQGISDAVIYLLTAEPSIPRRLARALAMIGELLVSPARVGSLLLPTDDPTRFTAKCFAWIMVGHIAGLLGRAGR